MSKAPSANLPAMLVAQLLPFIKNLCTRKWSDEDILEDVQFLRDELDTNFQSLTLVNCWGMSHSAFDTTPRTYDEYTSELSSGHLSWTPVHESEDFWKENAARLSDNDGEHLKWVALTHILSSIQLLWQNFDQASPYFNRSHRSCCRCSWYRTICQALWQRQKVKPFRLSFRSVPYKSLSTG